MTESSSSRSIAATASPSSTRRGTSTTRAARRSRAQPTSCSTRAIARLLLNLAGTKIVNSIGISILIEIIEKMLEVEGKLAFCASPRPSRRPSTSWASRSTPRSIPTRRAAVRPDRPPEDGGRRAPSARDLQLELARLAHEAATGAAGARRPGARSSGRGERGPRPPSTCDGERGFRREASAGEPALPEQAEAVPDDAGTFGFRAAACSSWTPARGLAELPPSRGRAGARGRRLGARVAARQRRLRAPATSRPRRAACSSRRSTTSASPSPARSISSGCARRS